MQHFPPYFASYENHTTQNASAPTPQLNQESHPSTSQPLLSGSNLAIYSPAGLQPLSVLAAAQRKDPMAHLSSPMTSTMPVELGAHGKPKRKQVKNACVNCQKACKKCDIGRPCQRCIKYGITDTCIDSVRKERKRGIKRGPYKKRNKGNGPSSGASTPSIASPMTGAPMYNNTRPTGMPMSYQQFPSGHYDPYAVYSSNGQMMPPYMVPAAIQQMYPNNSAMSYQAAMNIISPQAPSPQEQQAVQHNSQPPMDTQDSKLKEQEDDDEGSKLNILSRLCSAVLDRNDGPKQEETTKPGNQENTPPPSRPHSAA
ncbi:hypothetical protein BY458DRAFT_433794 [Sporodiniella umbellata]|nr:hypothetical protein BY458DRAFT_433794 [Sporodiniella umbellata]